MKPCPNCNCHAISVYMIDGGLSQAGHCLSCEMRGPKALTKEEAIAAWDALPRAVVCPECHGLPITECDVRQVPMMFIGGEKVCARCRGKKQVLA